MPHRPSWNVTAGSSVFAATPQDASCVVYHTRTPARAPYSDPSHTGVVVPSYLTSSRPVCYAVGRYTYCISTHNSARVLSYPWLPTSIQCGEAMARRRKSDGRVSHASRGMVRRWGHCFSRVRPQGVLERERVSERCHASGAAVDVCSATPAGAQRAERAAHGGVVDVSFAHAVSPRAPCISAQRVARFALSNSRNYLPP